MNNEFKIFNPYTKVETTVTVDDDNDTFEVVGEKIINNDILSNLKVGNMWEPLEKDLKTILKIVKKKKKVKRPAKTFGKNKNK